MWQGCGFWVCCSWGVVPGRLIGQVKVIVLMRSPSFLVTLGTGDGREKCGVGKQLKSWMTNEDIGAEPRKNYTNKNPKKLSPEHCVGSGRPKSLGSEESTVAKLKLKGIEGRRLHQHNQLHLPLDPTAQPLHCSRARAHTPATVKFAPFETRWPSWAWTQLLV